MASLWIEFNTGGQPVYVTLTRTEGTMAELVAEVATYSEELESWKDVPPSREAEAVKAWTRLPPSRELAAMFLQWAGQEELCALPAVDWKQPPDGPHFTVKDGKMVLRGYESPELVRKRLKLVRA